MHNFYVYEHWRPDTNRPFYVGKGRAWRASSLSGRSGRHKRVVAKAGRPVVKFVATGLDEDEAFRLECERIALWRSFGLPLANFTDGGEGVSGMKHSDETRCKMSAAAVGKNKGKTPWKGRAHSEYTRAKMSAAKKAMTTTTKVKMSEAAKVRCARETAARNGACRNGHSDPPRNGKGRCLTCDRERDRLRYRAKVGAAATAPTSVTW